jgi:hypothetical protein
MHHGNCFSLAAFILFVLAASMCPPAKVQPWRGAGTLTLAFFFTG